MRIFQFHIESTYLIFANNNHNVKTIPHLKFVCRTGMQQTLSELKANTLLLLVEVRS